MSGGAQFRRLVVACCVLALALAACSRGAESGDAGSAPTTASESFDPKVVDEFVTKLAAAGIGVFELGSGTPVVPVAEPVSPVRLTEEQAANLAVGAWAGAGQTGAQLDSLVTTEPVAPGAEPIPASLLIIGWAQVAPGPAAKLAKQLLGKQDWANYGSVVVPTAVLLLFAADIAQAATAESGGAGGGAAGRPANPQLSVCEQVKDFVYGSIDAVFKAIGHLELKGYSGDVLSDILTFFRNVGASIINFGIDKIKSVVVNGVELVFGPVLRGIAAVAGVVAVAGQILAIVQSWTGWLTPNPKIFTRDTQSHPGVLTLRVWTHGMQEWPTQVAGCARAANVELPPLKPRGAKVDWTIDYQRPAPMVDKVSGARTLAEDGTAKLRFETLPESPEVAAGETRYDGSVRVTAVVHRTELDQLHKRLTDYLLAQLPAPVAQVFGPWIHGILDPRIKTLVEPLSKLRDTTARFIVSVNYHTPDDEPTPRPSNGTDPNGSGKKAVLPKGCPSRAVSQFGYRQHGRAMMQGALTCWYHSKPGSVQLAIAIHQGPIPKTYIAKDAEPIDIPGVDEAWYFDTCPESPSMCAGVDVIVGKGFLRLMGGSASKQKQIAMAKRILGVG